MCEMFVWNWFNTSSMNFFFQNYKLYLLFALRYLFGGLYKFKTMHSNYFVCKHMSSCDAMTLFSELTWRYNVMSWHYVIRRTPRSLTPTILLFRQIHRRGAGAHSSPVDSNYCLHYLIKMPNNWTFTVTKWMETNCVFCRALRWEIRES